SLKTSAAYGLAASQSTTTRASRGRSSLSNSSRLPPSSGAIRLIPVTLPPGRARLATSPLPNGSPAAVMTIGMVVVARLAANGARVPIPTMKLGQPFNPILREATLDDHILPFDPSQLPQSIGEHNSAQNAD